jgi:hypothetical protein
MTMITMMMASLKIMFARNMRINILMQNMLPMRKRMMNRLMSPKMMVTMIFKSQ